MDTFAFETVREVEVAGEHIPRIHRFGVARVCGIPIAGVIE
jgi:hypothetical protein